jgi:membrane fusion protein, multidrug efflux system
MLQHAAILAILAISLAGCGKSGPGSDAVAKSAPPPALLLAPEDVITLKTGTVTNGPLITGSIQPERRADLRAEISAVVMAVHKENGDPVRKGDLLVRLDDTALRDSLLSAQEAERAASQAFDQAQRQVQRQKTLRESGMT